MNNRLEVKIAETPTQLQTLFDIRRKVFVEEQKVDPAEEYDDFEETSTHLLAILEGRPVGTARIRRTINGVKLERFAVLKEERGQGIGAHLLMKSLEIADNRANIYLHAQIQVVDFYSKFGFVKEGEEFEEAGIMHYKMNYEG